MVKKAPICRTHPVWQTTIQDWIQSSALERPFAPINISLLHTASCRNFDFSKYLVLHYMGTLPSYCSGTFRLLFVSFLSGPRASWANGEAFYLCHPSCILYVTAKKSPFFVYPADRYFTLQSRHTFYQIPFI